MHNDHGMSDMEALQVIAAACGEGSQRSNAEQHLRKIQRMLSVLDSQGEVLEQRGAACGEGARSWNQHHPHQNQLLQATSQLQSMVVHQMQLLFAASP